MLNLFSIGFGRYSGVISWILGFFLLAVSLDKVFHYEQFFAILRRYWFLKPASAPYVGVTVIISEFVCGVGLLISSIRRVGAYLGSLTLLVITVGAILQQYVRPDSSCGCWFALGDAKLTVLHVFANLVFAVVLLLIGVGVHKSVNPDQYTKENKKMKKLYRSMFPLVFALAAIITLVANHATIAVTGPGCNALGSDCLPNGTNRCYRASDGTICMKNLAAD